MKLTIEKRLERKTVAEINAIAKRIGYPLYGNKDQRIHQLSEHFDFERKCKIIMR